MSTTLHTILLGLGATAAMDLAGWTLQRAAGLPMPNYALVGRWIAHMRHGRFRHASIAASPAAAGERALGWLAHYAVGIGFAALLVALAGSGWLRSPSLPPALGVGLATVAAPFLLMQPAMGLGLAARRAGNPWQARRRSLLNHLLFGAGLYLAGRALSGLAA